MKKIRRHWAWLRSDGLRAYLEEHDLNLAVRVPRDLRKVAWGLRHGTRGTATPLFIVGAQRSGTNMITHGLEMAPDVSVYNEGNRAAFRGFRLKELSRIERIIAQQRSRLVVFKPLCDSHNIDRILDDVSSTVPPRALWIWRHVEGRVRSAIAKFPTSNLDVIRGWVAGRETDHWQLQRMSPASAEFLSSLDVDKMSPATAAAAFWYVRNNLYFELGLDERPDLITVSYDSFIRQPDAEMRRITEFCRVDYRSDLVRHIKPNLAARHDTSDPSIDPRVAARCQMLTERLSSTMTASVGRRDQA